MTIGIDELQRLYEAATPGEWEHGIFWIKSKKGHLVLADCDDGAMDEDHILYVVSLHNAWPAIHRVLVAARKLADLTESNQIVFAEELEALLEKVVLGLRALDGKEQ